MTNYDRYFAQTAVTRQKEHTEEPVPVTTVPSPTSILGYGVNSIILIFCFYILRPVLDKGYLFWNTQAKMKKEKEDRAMELQIKQAEETNRVLKDYQTFMQSTIQQQTNLLSVDFIDAIKDLTEQNVLIFSEIQKQTIALNNLNTTIEKLGKLSDLGTQVTVISSEIKKQTQSFQNAFSTLGTLSVQIDKPVKIVNDHK
ncbi:hypothetical protein DAPPUDRAFT_335266 [Daphnia pulex]|uniref:Uncharacterized protein n=1 Tax=Daphnia pulex TaxID=6669 RepID=E9HXB0_DAPPU|nr:hypothetical protein DAPPUDRAFT_335266 [Daphnia pulex]|eukprot:EFX63614.1 hypothetical protein DAPPUDRAFT_335266 [Daphnia pulex]